MPSRLTLTRLEKTEQVDFDLRDERLRRLGARVSYTVKTFEPAPDGSGGPSFYDVEPGSYFCAHLQATRDEADFGAFQKDRIFATAEEREAAVEKYLAEAKKRASKKSSGR